MPESNESNYPVNSYAIIEREQRNPNWAFADIVECTEVELQTGLTKLRRERRQRKRRERMQSLFHHWPVWGGALFACLAPVIYGLVVPLGPWAVRVLFPLAALAGYHGMQFGAAVSRMLPQILIYLQFPVEGLLAKIALRKRVTFAGVAGQLFLFHLLSAVGLWLIRDALTQNPIR